MGPYLGKASKCYLEPQSLFWWLLGILTLMRLIYAYWLPLDLSGDETYYWDWGRQPDWGYFSKPPLIGWLMASIGLAGFDSTFGIRACATLLVALGLALYFWLGRELADTQTAIWATLLLALAPAVSVLGLVLTIDIPLLLCWVGALLAFHRWIQGEGGSRAGGWRWCSASAWAPCPSRPCCVFHAKVDTDSTGSWTVIPRQAGHLK